MASNHNPIILKLANRIKKYKSIHSFFKKVYYYFCYLYSSNKSQRYEVLDGLSVQFPVDIQRDYFFGYYHSSPWSYDDNFIAINSVINSKVLQINIIDLSTSKLKVIDETTLWNFQQGAMLGWFPGEHKVYYNKLIDGTYKTVLYDISNDRKDFFDLPIQIVHPSGKYYLSINYRSLFKINKDYGYAEDCKFFSNQGVGIWKCFFDKSKKPELIISKSDMLKTPLPLDRENYNFEYNHCLFSDNGDYFLFINRYKDGGNKCSKLILASTEHREFNLQVINKDFVSHMCWLDNENLFYFGDAKDDSIGYYINNIKSSKSRKVMPENFNDGHPSASKNNDWVVLDSYPDSRCDSHLYLYNIIQDHIISHNII